MYLRALPRTRSAGYFFSLSTILSLAAATQADGGGTPSSREESAAPAEEVKLPAVTIRREAPKVGRNDPCPCDSGKKFKNCHGA